MLNRNRFENEKVTPYGYRFVFFNLFSPTTANSECTITFVKPISLLGVVNGNGGSTQSLDVYFPLESQMPVLANFTDNSGTGMTINFNSRINSVIRISPRSTVTARNLVEWPEPIITRQIRFRLAVATVYGIGLLMKPFK